MPRDRLTAKEIPIVDLARQGLPNREIGKMTGTTEQVIKNHSQATFDKLGIWSRLELAMYVASHGGRDWVGDSDHPGLLTETRRGERMLVSGTHLQPRPYAGDN